MRPNPENQRALLPEVRPETEHGPVERRADLLHPVHGEIHVRLEPGQRHLHPPVTAGAAINKMLLFVVVVVGAGVGGS